MPYKIDISASASVKLAGKAKKQNNTNQVVSNSTNSNNNALSRSQQKELDAARKDGTIPALKDEKGRDINPHTPLFIMQTPWYFDSLHPTLKHQEKLVVPKQQNISGNNAQSSNRDDYYESNRFFDFVEPRGTSGVKSRTFKAGSCSNCGSETHSAKECFERPRKFGAKYTNVNIAENDLIMSNEEAEALNEIKSKNFDAKRDRWNNYDIAEHDRIHEEYAKLEDERNRLKAESIKQSIADKNSDGAISSIDNGESVDEGVNQKVDSKQRITVRNLRIREDTAKYLYNLDLDSAYYDPMSRSMRENPFAGKNVDFEELSYRGDNEFYKSKEMSEFLKKQVFAWNSSNNGANTNDAAMSMQALPTMTEYRYREYENKSKNDNEEFKKQLHQRYGGEEHTKRDQVGIFAKGEYTEFTQSGQKTNQHVKVPIQSRYIEDSLINNHTEIYGSYYSDGKWGYKCCHSTIKNSYCGGLASKISLQKSINMKQYANAVK